MHLATTHEALAARFVPEQGTQRAAALAGLAVLGALILWASAKISVPFWPVPMTLQTGAVVMLAAAYGLRLGLATVLLYLGAGALGVPVFQGTPQMGLGLPYMLGPTGGYLLGFVVATAIVGWLVERGADRGPGRLFGAMLLGDMALFLLGFAWLAWLAMLPTGAVGIGVEKAFAGGVLPFLLGDLVKVALAACLVAGVGRVVRR